MKTKLLLVFFALFSSATARSQYSYDWAKRLAGGYTDWAYDVCADPNENVISCGAFLIAADFDPGDAIVELTAPDNDLRAYLSKLDQNGNYIWALALAGESTGRSVVTDAQGNIYAAGSFRNSFDFDNGTSVSMVGSNGVNDAYLAKYAPDGSPIWVKTFGGEGQDAIVRLAINADGELAVCGYFAQTVDFNPDAGEDIKTVIGEPSTNDIFISKFDTEGNFQWVHHMGGPSSMNPEDVEFDLDGNVISTGRFAQDMNCDPGVSDFTFDSNGALDWNIFVMKLDNDGNFQWAKRVDGADSDVGFGIAIDNLNHIIYTGHFGMTADFDPGAGVAELTVNGTWYDIFVSKLDNDGNFIWAKQMGSETNDYGADVDVDEFGSIYTTGYTTGSCDFDPGEGVATDDWEGAADVFISVIDTYGNYLWGQNFGAHEDDWGNAIDVQGGHFYVTGLYKNNYANFGDFDLMGAGNEDVFVFKLAYPWEDAVRENESERELIKLYPNPANSILRIQSDKIDTNKIDRIIITDLSGKQVLELSEFNFNNGIVVSGLTDGIYTLCVQLDDIITHYNFITNN